MEGVGADYISTPDHADFEFGAGEFTIEFFVRFRTVTANSHCFIAHWGGAGQRSYHVHWAVGAAALQLNYTTDGTNVVEVNRAWSPSINTWYHVAVCRGGDTLRMFIDGTQIGTNIDFTGITLATSTQLFSIGAPVTLTIESVDGWMDEIRISNTARYTADFTAPAAAFTCAETGTVLLVHCDGDDASTTFTDDDSACVAVADNHFLLMGV